MAAGASALAQTHAPAEPVDESHQHAHGPASEHAHGDGHAGHDHEVNPDRPLSPEERNELQDAAANAAYKRAFAALSPRDALQRLIDGNARYVAGESTFVGVDQIRRCDTFLGQQPAALVLTSSDSRVAPEFIFDAGLGELFTLRNFGNVVGSSELGSAEYAVSRLNTPVLVVMGHTHCGAVASVAHAEHGNDHGHDPMPQYLAEFLEQIQPVVDELGGSKPGDKELLARAIEGNVYQSMGKLLKQSPEIRLAVAEGRTAVIGAVYDIHLGQVTWLGRHPQESSLLQGPITPGADGVAEGVEPDVDHESHLEVATEAHPTENDVVVEIGTEPIGPH